MVWELRIFWPWICGSVCLSGQGKESEIPIEIKGWNWGAFIFSWIWGIGNNTYRAFWVFFPLVNIIMMIALGLKGNEWAWRHKKWESVEHFKQVQRKWTKAALIFLVVVLFSLLLFLLLLKMLLLKNQK